MIGSAEAARALAAGLTDREPRIREATINALGSFRDLSAVVLVRPALGGAMDYVRAAALEVLAPLTQ